MSKENNKQDFIGEIEKGDKIQLNGLVCIVDKVYYSDHYEGFYDCEFIDTLGNYRHWKQYHDGGILIKEDK